MNTRDRITFVSQTGKRRYDPDLGQYVEPETKETTIGCDVSDLGVKLSIQLFGQYKDGNIAVHLARQYNKSFNYAIYRNVKYVLTGKSLDGLVYYLERDTAVV